MMMMKYYFKLIYMEVIALSGKPNCGKTMTLKEVFQILISKNYVELSEYRKEIPNPESDFITILEKDNEKLGLVTQGDYVNHKHSVKNHLNYLKSNHCSKAICACTKKNTTPTTLDQVREYLRNTIVEKTVSVNTREYKDINVTDALRLVNLL